MGSLGVKKAPLLVTAAIVRDGGKFLISQRKFNSGNQGGKWEFPGGKVEFGEHPEASLIREIKEELDIEVEIERYFDVVSHVYEKQGEPFHIVMLVYLARQVAGVLRPLDVENAIWVLPDELRNFSFAAADVPVVQKLIAGKI